MALSSSQGFVENTTMKADQIEFLTPDSYLVHSDAALLPHQHTKQLVSKQQLCAGSTDCPVRPHAFPPRLLPANASIASCSDAIPRAFASTAGFCIEGMCDVTATCDTSLTSAKRFVCDGTKTTTYTNM